MEMHHADNWISQWEDSDLDTSYEVLVLPTPPPRRPQLGLLAGDSYLWGQRNGEDSEAFLLRKCGTKSPRIDDVDNKDRWACVVEDTPDRVRAKATKDEFNALLKQKEDHYIDVGEMKKAKQRLELGEIALYSQEDRNLELDISNDLYATDV